jgi:glycine hydroxymethyltransferase
LDKNIFPGIQGGPLMHIIAAKAVSFKEALSQEFKSYAHQIVINARTLAQELQRRGLSLISGGTDNHLILVNVSGNGITGAEAEMALDAAGIALNKNVIPFDTLGPKKTSGIRIGTPAVNTRGMKEKQMVYIAELIARVLERWSDKPFLTKIRKEVKDFCHDYPVYAEI